jgi:hypothetical protein
VARLGCALALTTLVAPALAGDNGPCSKTWIGHEEQIETYLRTAEVERMEVVPIGVTKPKRMYFKPGGPVASAAWKPLAPGLHRGYWDSYKSEIAAYELDKLLGMQMVPPVVEREIDGDRGAVVMWVDGVRSWKINEPVRGPDAMAWDRQVIGMKMFDQLIGNTDRNQGNLLYDAEYHLILIDHSRAFTRARDLRNIVRPTRIDRELWTRMEALTSEQLDPLADVIGRAEARAILDRRDLMRRQIKSLVDERGEQAVFVP